MLSIRCDVDDEDSERKALVTGGSGCLGTEIVSQLVADGQYAVHSLDLCIPPEEGRISGVASYIQADITNKNDLLKAFEGIDVVFHTVALLPFSIRNTLHAMKRVNVEGTRNVVEACEESGVKRLIHTSSCSVTMSKSLHSRKSEEVNEYFPLPDDPLNAYVYTKGIAEMIVRKANSVSGLATCALRLGGLMGGKKNPTMSEFVATPMRRLGKGDYCIAWTTVKAAAEVHLIADKHISRKPVNSRTNVFNVISANINYRDMIAFCAQHNSDSKKAPLVVPMWIGKLLANINKSVFWLTGRTPFDERVNSASLDYFQPLVCSGKHTEKELEWAEHRPWQEIVKEVIKEYKTAHGQCS